MHNYSATESATTHFGLILALTINGLAVSRYRDMVDISHTAERYGFDSVWLCDHFLTLSPDDYVKDAGITRDDTDIDAGAGPRSLPLLEGWTALAALARDTTTLRLGTSVLCNSYRYPSVLAKMAATLDVISEGRLELGLGAGWFQREFEAYGIPFPSVGTASQLCRNRLTSSKRFGLRTIHDSLDGSTQWMGRYATPNLTRRHTRRCGWAVKETECNASRRALRTGSISGGGHQTKCAHAKTFSTRRAPPLGVTPRPCSCRSPRCSRRLSPPNNKNRSVRSSHPFLPQA